jgi:hypothetical protein
MPIFKKKPPQVDARQVEVGKTESLVDWLKAAGGSVTLATVASVGDWIVRDGATFVIMTASAFNETYEVA